MIVLRTLTHCPGLVRVSEIMLVGGMRWPGAKAVVRVIILSTSLALRTVLNLLSRSRGTGKPRLGCRRRWWSTRIRARAGWGKLCRLEWLELLGPGVSSRAMWGTCFLLGKFNGVKWLLSYFVVGFKIRKMIWFWFWLVLIMRKAFVDLITVSEIPAIEKDGVEHWRQQLGLWLPRWQAL